jgi:hypothetical protein
LVPSNSNPRYILKRIENKYSNQNKANLHMNVNRGTIQNTQKMKITQVSIEFSKRIHEWLKHRLFTELSIIKLWKEWSSGMCYDTDDCANIMLSERNQTQKVTNYMILFIWNIQKNKKKSIETERRLVVARGWLRERAMEWLTSIHLDWLKRFGTLSRYHTPPEVHLKRVKMVTVNFTSTKK